MDDEVVHFDEIAFDYVEWDAEDRTLVLRVGAPDLADEYDTSEEGDPLQLLVVAGREVLVGVDIMSADTRAEMPDGITITLPDGHVMRSPDVADFLRRQATTAR